MWPAGTCYFVPQKAHLFECVYPKQMIFVCSVPSSPTQRPGGLGLLRALVKARRALRAVAPKSPASPGLRVSGESSDGCNLDCISTFLTTKTRVFHSNIASHLIKPSICQCLRHPEASMMSSLSRVLRSLISSFALEAKLAKISPRLGRKYLLKIRSASQEVGGIDKISRATRESCG
jgi:hypothetical protein